MKAIINPVDAVIGVWHLEREPYHRIRTHSTPGHLLHLLTKGRYNLTIDKRPYTATEGDIIAYYNAEEVVWIENEVPVEFYSVAFQAPGLTPLPVESRVFRVPEYFKRLFEEIFASFNATESPASTLRCFNALHSVLAGIYTTVGAHLTSRVEPGSLWWEVEQNLYERSQWRPSIKELCRISGVSAATLIRLCRAATGMPPHKRITHLRLRHALGLLRYTAMSVTEASILLGYPRLQEFSREFSEFYGYPPKEAEKRNMEIENIR
jgi:AraC-like DNA-binding protein